jgi:hypothetical protein
MVRKKAFEGACITDLKMRTTHKQPVAGGQKPDTTRPSAQIPSGHFETFT